MISSENIGFILAIVLISIWIIIIFIDDYRENHKPLPKFCAKCGCPMKKSWSKGTPKFHPKTGIGTQINTAVLVCINSKEGGGDWDDHSWEWLKETREIPVKSECEI